MDDATLNWPVDEKYQDDVDLIKSEYRAVSLCVYHDNQFIKPSDVKEGLKNALVEIHFTLFYILLSNQHLPKDTYYANIKQIIILRNEALITSTYCGDPRKGPVKITTHSPPPLSPPPPKWTCTTQSSYKGKERSVTEHDIKRLHESNLECDTTNSGKN